MAKKRYKSTPKRTKSIVFKAVVFPLVAGIIIALLTVFVGFGGSFFDMPKGFAVSYFDGKNGGTKIAQITCADAELPVIDNYEYSSLADSVCYKKGANFGEVGVGYYLALDNNIKSFDEQNITVLAGEKTYSYKYKGKFSADNETEVLNHICNMSKGFVLYTQNAEKYGFSSGYTAYIYEEVAE